MSRRLLRPRTVRSRWKAIERIFRDSETREHRGLPLRLTTHGTWVPTPFPVLASLLRETSARSLFRSRGPGRNTIIEAGSGDGRVLASLACFEPELEVVGIESDERLFRLADDNLEKVKRNALVSRPERLRIRRGDYRQVGTYESAGIELESVAFIINYPDGNQEELERFVIERAPSGVKLCLLTHDAGLRLEALALISKETVRAPGSSEWFWSVYGA